MNERFPSLRLSWQVVIRNWMVYRKDFLANISPTLADPALTLKQAMTRYYVVMRAAGITRKGLGITSHGLRKEFANKTYFELTGVKSPVQGGPPIDRVVDREARLRLVEHLGHARESVGAAYLGAIRHRPSLEDDALALQARDLV